jgi:hypothetical protein
MKCDPPECILLQERIAIMQYDGKMMESMARTHAISSECTTCPARQDKPKSAILAEL